MHLSSLLRKRLISSDDAMICLGIYVVEVSPDPNLFSEDTWYGTHVP